MYQNKIFNLYLSKARMEFRDEYGNNIPLCDEVGDHADPIISSDKYCPDFMLRGFFFKTCHNLLNRFIISKDGPQVLFITGIPLNSSYSLNNFKFKNPRYVSFYQDDVKGVLFQVLDKSPIYLGISKSQGIKQFNQLSV